MKRKKKRQPYLNPGPVQRMHKPETVADMRTLMDRMAKHVGEYAGIPVTVKGQPIVVHKSYRFAQVFEDERKKQEAEEPDGPRITVINKWVSGVKKGAYAVIGRLPDGRLHGGYWPMDNPITMQFMTLGAAVVWDIATEQKALKKLQSLVTPHAFATYQLTGAFLETSRRSKVTYMFRRLRPTLAISSRGGEVKVLCGLCLHPIGYYTGTWAGAMVPTDEVVSHLLLMRGAEHLFWKQANQHPAWHATSGL